MTNAGLYGDRQMAVAGNGSQAGSGAVLIPAEFGPACSYPCVRSLGRRGIDVVVASEHRYPVAAVSRFCDETVDLPDPRADVDDYASALLDVAARPEVRSAIPTREEDAYVFSRHRAEFEDHVDLLVPDFETLRTVHDRVRLVAAAESAGVPVPETRSMDEVGSWDEPLVVKSRFNLLADAYVDAYPAGALDTVKGVHHLAPGETPDEAAILAEMDHVPIVQEYVPSSDEYVFAALYAHGEPLATFQHRQVRGDSYVGGGGVYRKSVFDPELERVGRTLLSHLDWHGLACIEYMKHAETGEFVLTEVNPRTWQSLPAAVKAGADFPHYYWLAATGRADHIDPEYELDCGSHCLYGELGHLGSLFRDDSPHVECPGFAPTLLEVLSSFYEDPRLDYTHIDDPAPVVHGLRRVVGNKLK